MPVLAPTGDPLLDAILEIRANADNLLAGGLAHFDKRDFAGAVRATCRAALKARAREAVAAGRFRCEECGLEKDRTEEERSVPRVCIDCVDRLSDDAP